MRDTKRFQNLDIHTLDPTPAPINTRVFLLTSARMVAESPINLLFLRDLINTAVYHGQFIRVPSEIMEHRQGCHVLIYFGVCRIAQRDSRTK